MIREILRTTGRSLMPISIPCGACIRRIDVVERSPEKGSKTECLFPKEDRLVMFVEGDLRWRFCSIWRYLLGFSLWANVDRYVDIHILCHKDDRMFVDRIYGFASWLRRLDVRFSVSLVIPVAASPICRRKIKSRIDLLQEATAIEFRPSVLE